MFMRALSPSDSGAVASLWFAGALESANSDPRFAPRIGAPDYALKIGAELESKAIFGWGTSESAGGTLIGYLTAKITDPSPDWRMDGCLYVLDVDVHRDHRRQGLARLLIANATTYAQGLGIGRMELSWLASDPHADAVWRQLGFRPYLHRGHIDIPSSNEHTGA